MSQPINLRRERQARRPILDRYRGPSQALAAAEVELDELAALAGQSLFTDSAEVIAVCAEVRRIVTAVYEARQNELDRTGGMP